MRPDLSLESVRETSDELWQRFNLATDLGKQHNLASEQPGRVVEIGQTFETSQDSF